MAGAQVEQRGGPTGRDVIGPDGRAFRPTSLRGWEVMATKLKERKVGFMAPQEVVAAQRRGVAVIDIRPVAEWEQAHIPGAVNVEFMRLISGWDAWQVVRKTAFAFFGISNGTEANPDFVEEVAAVAGRGKPVVLICNLGGSLDPDYQPSKDGQQSRSLMAAYELYCSGYSKLSVLKGGMSEWQRAERPVATADDES